MPPGFFGASVQPLPRRKKTAFGFSGISGGSHVPVAAAECYGYEVGGAAGDFGTIGSGCDNRFPEWPAGDFANVLMANVSAAPNPSFSPQLSEPPPPSLRNMEARIVRIMPLPPANAPHADRRGGIRRKFCAACPCSRGKKQRKFSAPFCAPMRYENLIGVWDFIRFPILK